VYNKRKNSSFKTFFIFCLLINIYNWGDYFLFASVFIYKNNHIEIL
jgi:hypothetical protein